MNDRRTGCAIVALTSAFSWLAVLFTIWLVVELSHH